MNAPATDRFVVPIGPQHPALKEPGHFEFTVEGRTKKSKAPKSDLVVLAQRNFAKLVATA